MGLIDYSRSFKALLKLYLLFVCMSYFENQNGKVLEETLTESNPDALKTIVKHLRYFIFYFESQAFQTSVPIPLSLCHIQ